jgi:hypothetical protein
MKDLSKLLDALNTGVCTIEFEKLDTGEIRVMPCTCNPKYANKHFPRISQSSQSDTIVTYALDKRDWRDVRVNTIQRWHKHYENKYGDL